MVIIRPIIIIGIAAPEKKKANELCVRVCVRPLRAKRLWVRARARARSVSNNSDSGCGWIRMRVVCVSGQLSAFFVTGFVCVTGRGGGGRISEDCLRGREDRWESAYFPAKSVSRGCFLLLSAFLLMLG